MTYTIVVTPLSDEDGGGFLGLVPDLHGCMSDGETRAEAIKNTEDAIEEWISLHKSIGREIPRPGCATKAAAEKQKHLLDALQALLAYADDVDGRLDQIEADLREIRARIDSGLEWDRLVAVSSIASIAKGHTHSVC